jgi:alkanesulfonate monooxygenase SsuD/methylene tetrahydromethanopterin reductase-like flavin-dependent oxidoreductase (luciferase family)
MTRIQFEGMRGSAGSLVIGDPETVADKIVRWAKVLGIVRFMLHISVGTMPHDLVLNSIELFGKEVAPRVRQALG